jgi:hypothetical protein
MRLLPTFIIATSIVFILPAHEALSAESQVRRIEARTEFEQIYPTTKFYTEGERITRVYGMPFGVGRTPAEAAETFVRDHSRMFGVPAHELVPSGTQDVMQGKFTAIYFDQTHQGLPVHRAWMTVLVRHDIGNGVVLASAELFDLSDVAVPALRNSGEEVVASLMARYPDYTFSKPELVIYRGEIDGQEDLKVIPAYRLIGHNQFDYERFDNTVVPEVYEFIVDASRADMPVVSKESRIYHVDVMGQVMGMGTSGELPDRVDNPPVLQAMEDLRVRIVGGNVGLTNASGNYVISHPGSSSVTVETSVGSSGSTQAGPWVSVSNFGGSPLSLSTSVTPPGPADFLFNPAPSEFLTAQVNCFRMTTEVHNFVKSINPAYPGVDVQMPCSVNRTDGFCPGNAWYNFSVNINFCRAGSGYPNTAYSSVVYHEYGHHIVAAGHPSATGDFHEGVADVTANLLMNTNCLGRGFTGGSGCLRNAYNSQVYPCSGASHTCGQVISGAYWLTRDQLAISNPGDYLDIIRPLYLNMILLRPNGITPAVTIDVLTLDDDNGDITDGTPHYTEIATGFNAKNLTAPPVLPLRFTYPLGRPDHIHPGVQTPLRLEVTPLTADPEPGTARVFYDTGSGFVEGTAQVVSPNVYDLMLPAADCGTTIRYYVTADTTGGSTVTNPATAPTTTYSTLSAVDLIQFFHDDFETNQGWTVQNSGGLTDGAWERGVPAGGGARADPPTDYDGSGQCYLTANRPGNSDVDDGYTWLISPTFNLDSQDARIRYARWYSNSTGASPFTDTFVVYVSNNNGSTWTTVEVVGPTGPEVSGGWFVRDFVVSDYVTPTSQVRIRFEASDPLPASLVEAAVDAVFVEVIDCTFVPQQGDMTCNNILDAEDLEAFVIALIDPDAYAGKYPECDILRGDMNNDGLVNGDDIQGFVAVMSAGP